MDEDEESADLVALEKKLEAKNEAKNRSRETSINTNSNPASPNPKAPAEEASTSPASSMMSQETTKEKDDKGKARTTLEEDGNDEGVAQLSEMLCSLVTNHAGETRYIGKSQFFPHS